MEVVGVIAAVPALIEIIKTTTRLVRDVSNTRKALAKITRGLDSQLESLTNALGQIETKRNSNLASSTELKKLTPLLQQLGEQLNSLNAILSDASQSSGAFKRMTMVVGGVEKKLKDQVHRLEKSISLLNLNLLVCSLTLGEATVAANRVTTKVQIRDTLNPCGHEFIPKKLNGTLGWVLSHPTIARWLQPCPPVDRSPDPTARLLAIHGAKGCGKSVLAASLAHDMQAKGAACALFPYYHGLERQKKLTAMLATILWEILHIKDLPDRAWDLVCDSISTEIVTDASLSNTIEQVIGLLKKPLYMVIDGIDESTEDWNDVEGPLRIIRGWLEKHHTVHVLLVGRKSGLHLALKEIQVANVIELSEDITKDDIGKFIEYKLRETPNLETMSPELKLHVRETLQEKSMGMFLWIELVFKELRKCYSPASVRDCLMELPRDLDEEYFRLFKQVMHRLYGHQSKPSAQTKITRTLLAIIIGAVEPLSIDELRYAYAALCGTDSSWEDLISEDAIFDFLGDFVTCRDERIRFSHASVEEFLTRPLNEWPENQKEIGFFRLDHLECQQLVGSSCLDYLKVIDLGYPIADGSYGDLRHKPFLGYATRHGPLHWTHSLVANPSALPEFDAKLKAFIAMPQFISLVEYITMAMLNDFAFLDDCFHFLLLFEASDSDLLECTVARLHTETARRLAHFGPMDERTSSWKALEGLCVDLFLSRGIAGLTDGLLIDPAKAQLLLQTSVDLSRKPVPTAPTHEIATLASVEPNQPLSHVVRHRRQPVSNPKEAMESIMRSNMTAIMHVPSLSRALKIWTDPAEIRRKLVQAMAEKMPVPLHLLYADRSRTRGDEKMAQSLFESAVRRTEGKTTPYRAPALTGADAFCPYDWDSAVESEEQYRQAYDALLEFQDNPFAHIWMLQVVDARLTSLSYLGRAEERERIVTRSLRDPVASSTRHIRQWRNPLFEHFVYKRKWWIRQVNSRLEGIASTLKDEDVFKDAYRVLESLTERKKLLFGPHHWRVLHSEIDAGNMLLLNWKYLEAEQYFRDVLSSHDDKNLTKGEFLIAVTRFKLAKAVYFQGRHSDAIILFRDAKSHPSKKGCINWHQKCAIFISRCLRRIGEFEAARKELEMIPVEKVIDSLRNGTFLGLKDDELCWNALCNVHLHLDDHESVVAVRTRMHTLLDESLHLVGYKTRNALELVKSLKHMGAFSEAVKHLEELIDRFEGVAKSPNFDIERDRQVLVRARVVVLNALQGLEGSDEANRLRENISRCFLEDLNQYQQKGSVSAPMGTKTDLVVICEASEMAFGLAHEITRRFREYLSICYGKDESLDDEATEPVEIMKEDGDHPQDTDGCGDSNGHVDEDRDLDNNLIQGEVASFEEDLEDDGDRYSDFSVEKVTDEDSGTGHEEPIFETRMGKKFQSFWKLPGRDRD